MSDSLKISGPITVKSDDKHRVAFDLMREIASFETGISNREKNPREYYLELYNECLKVVSGYKPAHMQK